MSTGPAPRMPVGLGAIAFATLATLVFVGSAPGGVLRLVTAVVVLLLVATLYGPGGPGRLGSSASLPGSMIVALGAGGFFLGRLDLTSLAVAAITIDTLVGRLRLHRLAFGASSPRDAVTGDTVEVEVRITGVEGPVFVYLLTSTGPSAADVPEWPVPYQVTRESAGTLLFQTAHRGVHDGVWVRVVSVGWFGTTFSSRVEEVPLDAPLAVHPQAVRVELPVVAEEVDDDATTNRHARQGQEAQELRSLRPYVPGDPRRRVHWPTTARRGELAVVEVDGEVRSSVEVALELPGRPCGIPHAGSHLDHLDVLTGQARYTVEELWRRGIPVRLTTVETDADGRSRTVTAAPRNSVELGRRLAAADVGPVAAAADATRWLIGPAAGPARRVLPGTDGPDDPGLADSGRSAGVTGQPGGPDAVLLPDGTHAATRGPEPEPDRPDLAPTRVLGMIWAGTAGGILATLLLRDLELPGLVLLGGTIVAVAGATLRWWWWLDRRHLALAALFVLVAGAVLGSGSALSALVVALTTAWVLPRLVGQDLLERGEQRSVAEVVQRREELTAAHDLGDRSGPAASPDAASWIRRLTTGSFAAVLAAIGAAAVTTPGWLVGSIVGAAVLAGTVADRNSLRWSTLLSGVAFAALLASSTVAAPSVLVLATVAAAAGYLAAATEEQRGLPTLDGAPTGARLGALVLRVLVVTALVGLIVPVLGWRLDAHDRSASPGGSAGEGAPSEAWLGEQDRLDLTAPRGSGDRVVLTVDADLPSLLRDGSMGRWDGRTWWAAEPGDGQLASDDAVAQRVAAVTPEFSPEASPKDVAHVVNRQHITVRAAAAFVLPAAAEPVDVRAPEDVIMLPDGNLRAFAPLERGDTYEVVSRMPAPSAQMLRDASTGAVPREVLDNYTTPPHLSERTAQAIDAVAADLPTSYDQVRALEAWLGAQVSYSLDAPLPPPGVDVVDHFLYDAREGWCQQIATTLTLALRHLDVPARLVTGYVATEWDGRQYVVRERHRHAWVEVYFPGLGWQGFDPTESVPMATEAEPPPRSDELGVPMAVAAGLVLLVIVVVWLLRRRLRRDEAVSADGSVKDPHPWATAVDRRFQALAERCGIEREPGEGVADLADRLADHLGEDPLRDAARVVEQDAYGHRAPSRTQRQAAEQALDRAGVAAAPLAPADARPRES